MKKTKVESIGGDELYTEWYKCKSCGCDNIIESFKYCPKCGKEIEWGVK
jgi:predicted Zn-ribbon and HTH transcriptional regulator